MSKSSGLDLSGLDQFSSLLGGGSATAAPTQNQKSEPVLNQIILVPRSKIHLDPNNSRKIFDEAELKGLADSMTAINPLTSKPRGIKNPVSLKPHPELAGEYILNGGARRLAASEIAGIEDLPAYIDTEADDYDNAVDNIQRVGLSAMEMALFIKRRIDAGDKKGEIAKRLGKSGSFVTEHLSFFEMADCVRDLYDSDLVTSMQALYLLHRAYEKHPAEVEQLCAKGEPLSTAEVRAFVESLKQPQRNITVEDVPEMAINPADPNSESWTPENEKFNSEDQQFLTIDDESISGGDSQDTPDKQADKIIKDADSGDKIKKPLIQVRHDGRPARFIANRRSDYGFGWIKYDDDGHETEVSLSEVALIAVIEG